MNANRVSSLALGFLLIATGGFSQTTGTTEMAEPPARPDNRLMESLRPGDDATTRAARLRDRDMSTTDSLTSGGRRGRRREGPPLPPGTVAPTALGHLGGATSFTQTMPLDVESLIAMRRPFVNSPEFRGAWVTRFDWTGGRGRSFDPEACKQRIVEIMENARKLRLNAILFQVRGDTTTLYPSTIEPWSQLVGGKDPGFDPVKLAVAEAHKRGLEFHAYINPCPCSEERTTEPASPRHIYYKHCTADSSPNWLVFKDGKPAPFNEYKWLNPNLPEVQAHIRGVVLDFVKRYDVDGVHYDRIRFPGPDVSDDPWSKARFEGEANPHNKTYTEWQAENITRMLTDMYGEIMEVKPRIKVSAAVWGIHNKNLMPQSRDRAVGYSWTSSGLQDYMQDSIDWINKGCMDALVPMIYWNMGDNKPDYDELLLYFRSATLNGRHVYGGQSVFSKEEMIRQVVATNLIGAHGTVPFTLERISREENAEFYKKNIYPESVKTPEMAWKTKPVHGNLLVTVKDAAGKPVLDAHVTVSQRKDVALSALDGYCAILNLVPGDVGVRATRPGVGNASTTVSVARGKYHRVELKLK